MPIQPSGAPAADVNGSSSSAFATCNASASPTGPPACTTPITATTTSAKNISEPCITSAHEIARNPPKNV